MSHREFTVWCSCKGKAHSAEGAGEGATEEISLLTDSKNQPLEHELLGQGDPG